MPLNTPPPCSAMSQLRGFPCGDGCNDQRATTRRGSKNKRLMWLTCMNCAYITGTALSEQPSTSVKFDCKRCFVQQVLSFKMDSFFRMFLRNFIFFSAVESLECCAKFKKTQFLSSSLFIANYGGRTECASRSAFAAIIVNLRPIPIRWTMAHVYF